MRFTRNQLRTLRTGGKSFGIWQTRKLHQKFRLVLLGTITNLKIEQPTAELTHGATILKNVCLLWHHVWLTKALTQGYSVIWVMVTCGLMPLFRAAAHLVLVWLRFMLRTDKTTFQQYLAFLVIRSQGKNTTMLVAMLITLFLDVQFLKLIRSLILGYTLRTKEKKIIDHVANLSRIKLAECLIGLLKC